ncbi:hypothetical protein ADU59_06165 [Pararhizobium polonicum]|uniref:Uncharacterized protein n=2 Tax=Pararhizobium polonicum TaxID=1612624 RepID=A0A1C7P599_9HYPH|nr:hypothetical protein ADU59_06165 [Pararhizobium polonicum]
MCMRITVISGICAGFFNIGTATAMPVDMTVDRLLNICEAPTVQAAIVKGDELGWPRLTNAETEEWRTHFVGYNGGSVEVVGWRRDNTDGAEALSFWVAVGPNGHKACAYSARKPAGLLDALSQRLGAPDNLDKEDAIEMISASWKRGAVEYSFTQVGSSAVINIGPSQ